MPASTPLVHGSRKIPKEFRDLGFTHVVKGRSRHPTLIHPGLNLTLKVAGTPGDHRALKNDLAVARRLMRGVESADMGLTRGQTIQNPGQRILKIRQTRLDFIRYLQRKWGVPSDGELRIQLSMRGAALDFLKMHRDDSPYAVNNNGASSLVGFTLKHPGVKFVENNGRNGITIDLKGRNFTHRNEPPDELETVESVNGNGTHPEPSATVEHMPTQQQSEYQRQIADRKARIERLRTRQQEHPQAQVVELPSPPPEPAPVEPEPEAAQVEAQDPEAIVAELRARRENLQAEIGRLDELLSVFELVTPARMQELVRLFTQGTPRTP